MSTTAIQERRAALAATAKEIDRISGEAMTIFEQAGDFNQELQVAQAIVDMRLLLTDDVMRPVMALMNTDLGFRTDKDPKLSREPVTPYNVEVVREVFIEAKLRGFHACGNEFNIIAGRFYAAQSGFKRKVREATKGTFEASIDVPTISPDGKSAKIKCRATWKVEGKGDVHSIGIRPDDSCEFLVRVNAFMGADAINGKAERKLLKRVYERITGRSVPDGDLDEAPAPISTAATVQPAESPKFAAGAASNPPAAATPTQPAVETHKPAPAASTSNPDEQAEAAAGLAPQPELTVLPPAAATWPDKSTPQGKLEAFMTDAGVTFEKFRRWAIETERLDDGDKYSTWAELPAAFCEALQKDARSITKCVTRCKSY